MISFHYETDFVLPSKEGIFEKWVQEIISSEGKEEGDIAYIFCDDAYLLNINREFLNHDTLTDIITFDYTEDEMLGADIYISVERLEENAEEYKETFLNELLRVMAHGVLHLCGYKDKTDADSLKMREKESEKIHLFPKNNT